MLSGKIRLDGFISLMDEMQDVEEWKEVRERFHHLWTKYTGTDGYDKNEWKALDNALVALVLRMRGRP